MNAYDFDGTIYDGDSTLDFYLFCLKRHPGLLRYLPVQGYAIIQYALHYCSKTQMKERFYSFLKGLTQVEEEVKAFWQSHKRKIAEWYLENQKDDDVVISASPEFLLREICVELGIRHLIASRVDCASGKYHGENCYGEEKERRFRAEFGNVGIDKFYTDSQSDLPMARIASQVYLKVQGKFVEWEGV